MESIENNTEMVQPTDNPPKEESSKEDSDCEIIESPSTSQKFKLKQTRVHDWVKSPDQSYKDNISFKHDLPYWVDKFAHLFNYIGKVPPSPKKKNKKASRRGYIFKCKICSKRRKDLNIRGVGDFLRHFKVHKVEYKKFIEENPAFVPKKLKRRLH